MSTIIVSSKKDLTPSVLRALLSYDPATGVLTWKPRTPDMFEGLTEGECKAFNGKYAGKPALTNDGKGKYKRGAIFGVEVYAHRVAWALHYGTWPKHHIDHINGNGRDNRISNLRDVTRSENMKNRRLSNINTSGFHGVHKAYPDRDVWAAQIKSDGKHIHLGTFDTKAEAVAAREAAEKVLNFPPNHGRKS